jgi:ankyrin repeat protein
VALILLVLFVFSKLACGTRAERARNELSKRGLSFDVESFFHAIELSGEAQGEASVKSSETVGFFLEAGIDPRSVSEMGGRKRSALTYACERSSMIAVSLILGCGVRVDEADPSGETALVVASREHNAKLVFFLLARGANVDGLDSSGIGNSVSRGTTPLIAASAFSGLEVPKLLIAAGADIGSTNSDGFTALAIAIWWKRNETAKFLLAHGADPSRARKSTGETPLILAVKSGNLEGATLLLEKGAKIDDADNQGSTALLVAVIENKKEFVKFLSGKGADLSIKNMNGRDALELAGSKGFAEIVDILKSVRK